MIRFRDKPKVGRPVHSRVHSPPAVHTLKVRTGEDARRAYRAEYMRKRRALAGRGSPVAGEDGSGARVVPQKVGRP
jgi:hypothetical protein